MNIVKQAIDLPITNLDHTIGDDHRNSIRHSILLPNHVKGIICGSSGSGKTNAILSMLLHEHGLKFENVYVYSKSLYQPKYVMLEKIIENVPEVNYYAYSNMDEISEPSDVNSNSVFIFDDVSSTKSQNIIRAYFSMGRHKNIDCFYLCQSYAKIPKHLIRDNANFLIIFSQDETNLKHIYNDHVNSDMSFDNFKHICSDCWCENKYSTIVISKDDHISNGRYRKGLDKFIII